MSKSCLSSHQFDLVVHDPERDPESDPSLDPSVRFFGVDWQQIFARCFALSINFRIFRAQVIFLVQPGFCFEKSDYYSPVKI